jgi:hypothetical protein
MATPEDDSSTALLEQALHMLAAEQDETQALVRYVARHIVVEAC